MTETNRRTLRLHDARDDALEALVDGGEFPNVSEAIRAGIDRVCAAHDAAPATDTQGRLVLRTTEQAIPDPREREAIGLLAAAGWTTRELAMTFECSPGAIRRVRDVPEQLVADGGSFMRDCPNCEDQCSAAASYCPWCGVHLVAATPTTAYEVTDDD